METAEIYWRKLCIKLNVPDEICDTEWQNIYKAYSAKSRHYHNLSHIENMLHWLQQYDAENPLPAMDFHALKLAIFFHDIVYSANQKNNEEKSAKLATLFMQKAMLPTALQEAVAELIMATKLHGGKENNALVNMMTDLDLQILGAEEKNYTKYSGGVRKEYRIYPTPIYRPGRKKVLQYFIDMPRIYKTDFFYTRFEKTAKQNLQKEWDSIS